MIGYIDLAIPLGIGLLLIFSPQSFTKKTTDPTENELRSKKLRMIGYLLLGVGAIYALIKLLQVGR